MGRKGNKGKGKKSGWSDADLDRRETRLQEERLEVLQATLDAYAANPILDHLLDGPMPNWLAPGSRESAIMQEFKEKRRRVQQQLNWIRKEKRQRSGTNEEETSEALAMSEMARDSELHRGFYIANHMTHPHEWPESMRKLARDRALAAVGLAYTGSGSASSGSGNYQPATGGSASEVYPQEPGAKEDQPATGGSASEVYPQELGAKEDQPAGRPKDVSFFVQSMIVGQAARTWR